MIPCNSCSDSATDALKTRLSDMEYLRSKVAIVHEGDDGDVGGSAVSHCTDSAFESGNRDTVHTHKEKGSPGKMDIKQVSIYSSQNKQDC